MMTARPTSGVVIIGEVAQAHDGELPVAHRYIDAIADAGADAVKFQTHIAAAESTPSEPWRVKFSTVDATRYDYWKRMEFDEASWLELREHANERGLLFYSSPFSLEAVEMLTRVGVAGWKVASGEVANEAMMQAMAETGLGFIVSTGMSPMDEIDRMVERLRALGVPEFALLQCTSMYPTPAERLGLNMIGEFRERYGCRVGLSDHSGTIFPGIAAAALGADVLEVHVTLDRGGPGPDVSSSITPDELRTLVEGVRFIERAAAYPVDKDAVAEELAPMRDLFTKSVVARRDMKAGTVLQAADLVAKKPGTGIPADRLTEVIGRALLRDIEADELLSDSDLG